MKNQTFLTPSRGELGEALLRLCYGTEEHVQAGYYCALTVCTLNGQRTVHVSRRAFVWLFCSLGPQLTDCQLDAVAKGHAIRLEYSDCKNEAYVLGTYALADCQAFYQGLLAYAIKNRKASARLLRFGEWRAEQVRVETERLRAAEAAQIAPAPLTYEQALFACVEAGRLVAFTVRYADDDQFRSIVSPRAAVWLLQALEGREAGELEQGETVQISYQYGTHCALLGTFPLRDLYEFYRGKRDYCKRKYKNAVRAMRRKRLAAEKGGQTV